jgi:hypothetical protein
MPPTVTYLTCIGGDGIAGKNKSGVGARGYMISRAGRTVTRAYGAVTVKRGRGVRVHWLRSPTKIANTFETTEDAEAFVREILREKQEPGQGLHCS